MDGSLRLWRYLNEHRGTFDAFTAFYPMNKDIFTRTHL